jgi:hypothetical protein
MLWISRDLSLVVFKPPYLYFSNTVVNIGIVAKKIAHLSVLKNQMEDVTKLLD